MSRGPMKLFEKSIEADLERFFAEDDLASNIFYLQSLPNTIVECQLKIKSDLILCGLPYFVTAFNMLGAKLNEDSFRKLEGTHHKKGDVISFQLPFSSALSGERVALNLLQRASAVATFTEKFVAKAQKHNIKILDTRKTTPGLRSLEKYAVRLGGGYNHRFSQSDAWMIKDNHKTFFGGLAPAFEFFMKMQTHYQNIIVEIHSMEELELAQELGGRHVMLDNFTYDQVRSAVEMKKPGMTYEISGGVNLDNIEHFCIEGIDAISVGALTHSAPHVDLSMKIKGMKKEHHEF